MTRTILTLFLFPFLALSNCNGKAVVPKEPVKKELVRTQQVQQKLSEVEICEKDPDCIPPKVIEANKHVLSVWMEFYVTPNARLLFEYFDQSRPVDIHYGSGYMARPGIVVSARHVLLSGFIDFRKVFGHPFFLDKNGLPENQFLRYKYYGTTDVLDKSKRFPLYPIAMGELGLDRDHVLLRARQYPSGLKPLESDEELEEKNFVYCSGNISVAFEIPNIQGTSTVVEHPLNQPLRGEVVEVIEDAPINKFGIVTKYKIKGGLVRGYSGGPCFKSNGKVTATAVNYLEGFVFADSARDINMAVRRLKRKGLIK